MTVLAGGLSLVLGLVLSSFIGELGGAASLRARAQTAADASALAAAAESVAYGRGQPEEVASAYARANGGKLLDCLCERGATAMQVRVEVGGVAADARAVMDPELLGPAILGGEADGLVPAMKAAVARLVAASRGAVHVVSGYRSHAHQQQLWQEALARYGSAEAADDWVAPPGHSMHEKGLAVDLGGNLDLAVRLVEQLHLPLWRPMDHEPWHFELTGSRSS